MISVTGSWIISTDPLLFKSKPCFPSSVRAKQNPALFDRLLSESFKVQSLKINGLFAIYKCSKLRRLAV